MSQTFTIPKEALPSGKLAVELRVPTYGDLRKARKNYPFDRSESTARVGYVVDDLLMASLIVSLNGCSVDHYKDTIDRIGEIKVSDQQAIASIMTEMFFLSKEQGNTIYDLAKLKKTEPSEIYSFEAKDSPSKKMSFKFMEPNANVKMAAERQYPGINSAGCGLEEYLFAYCLSDLDGEQVTPGSKNNMLYLDNCSIADVQAATTFFMGVSSLDEEGRQETKKHATALLLQLKNPSVVTSPVTVTPTVALG